MNNDVGNEFERDPEADATELAAAELVAHVKQTDAEVTAPPIVDESFVWIVTVKRA